MTLAQEKVYSLISPEREKSVPIIVDSPHSGRLIPADADFQADARQHHCFLEDCDVDGLLNGLEGAGLTKLCAAFSRCYIDLNRRIDDIEDEMVLTDWPDSVKRNPSKKSRLGFGLFRRLYGDNTQFQPPLTYEQAMARIKGYYAVYHNILATQIAQLKAQHGYCLYLNVHSMPSRSAPQCRVSTFHSRQCDLIVSDRDGATANKKTRDGLVTLLRDHGFAVAVNDTYKGGELIHRHGDPKHNIDAIQIEINRALYLDEDSYKPNEKSNSFKQKFQSCLTTIKTPTIA